MILTIDINKDAPGFYTAHLLQADVEVGEPRGGYDRIEAAIQDVTRDIPSELAHFVEIRYGGMSTGTLVLSEIPGKAGYLADRLVALNAELHRIEETKRFNRA